MIRLSNLLTEITLGSTQPYANQFAWSSAERGWGTSISVKIPCDGLDVDFVFTTDTPSDSDASEYIFAYAVRPRGAAENFSMSHAPQAGTQSIDYMRLMRTIQEAMVSFIREYAPSSIDVTGFDYNTKSDLKKTRIYRNLLHSNRGMLQQLGYDVLDRAGRLWIVRNTQYDATGIKDKTND